MQKNKITNGKIYKGGGSIYEFDFYRMSGKKYTFKNFMIKIFKGDYVYLYLYAYRKKDKNLICKFIYKKLSKKYGLEILSNNIGKGLYLGHPYLINVNPETIIGDNCNLHKGVTIGQENRGKRKGAPIIGNEVWVGVNSTIVGKIKIGDDVLIAPNSYVNKDIPSHSIVLGNPCRIISKDNATENYINRKV